jgi:phosphodiesterase/alkaline phosphatase D-like protein
MRTHRAILVGLATLGLSVAGVAGQVGVAYGAQSEPSLLNVSSSVVRQASATLNATIAPGEAATVYHFEYGTSAAYGTSVPVPDAAIGGGREAVVVEQQLTGLQPDTTYHYRAIASNTLGRVVGSDETFTTPPLQPPSVSTGQAIGVGQNSATLTGTIETQGFETTYEFDLGADTSYGSRIFGDAGVEAGEQAYTVPLQGLAPGTTYHYRLLATNTFGTSYGVDVAFTTATYPSSALAAPVASALVPTLLLVPASTGSSGAKAASVKPIARTARRGKAKARKSSGRRPGGHSDGGRSTRAGHAHGANRRGK